MNSKLEEAVRKYSAGEQAPSNQVKSLGVHNVTAQNLSREEMKKMYDELSSNDRPRKILTEAERNAGPNHSYEILMKQVDDKITEYMKLHPHAQEQ